MIQVSSSRFQVILLAVCLYCMIILSHLLATAEGIHVTGQFTGKNGESMGDGVILVWGESSMRR